jgi:photosystem II stability/assembly factor-like uncharacterized protein
MSDFRNRLEQERRRFAMRGDSFQDLEKRRQRKHRNRRLASGLVALLIAGAGVGGGLYAFRPTSQEKLGHSPTPSVGPSVPSASPSPAETTPSPTPPIENLAAPPVAGAIEFVDDQRGWRVDPEDGRIFATTDGGHTWDVQLSSPSTVQAIDMLDGQVGWAVFDGGLLRTTDGGAHWDMWSNQFLTTVQFLTPDIGWGVGVLPDHQVGTLMKSEDGGKTWSEQKPDVDAVCFAGEQLGWAAGPSEGGISVFRTEDGGANWTEAGTGLEGGDTVGYAALMRCDGTGAWVLATGGAGAGHVAWALFRTVEGGPQAEPVLQDTFTHPVGQGGGVPEASNPQPGQLAILDGLTARVITWCPPCGGDAPYVSLERTDDGGATWIDPTVVDATHPGEPLGISFLDPDHGWVLLRDQQTSTLVVLRTSDGGQTWTEP